MGTVLKKVCDRCGSEIRYEGWTAILRNAIKKKSWLRVVKILNGNPDGYGYTEQDYELCAGCTKKLEDFLSGKEL